MYANTKLRRDSTNRGTHIVYHASENEFKFNVDTLQNNGKTPQKMNSNSSLGRHHSTGCKLNQNQRRDAHKLYGGMLLLTQKHHLCPGKPNFKPGLLFVDKIVLLRLESHFTIKSKVRIFIMINPPLWF